MITTMQRILIGALLAAPAAAQSLLYESLGNEDAFGDAMASIGDVDGDGVRDFVVGNPSTDVPFPNVGSVLVHSGQTGALLYSRTGDALGDSLGISVSGVGDWDGDGAEDFAAGMSTSNPVGKVRVYSGAGGGVLATIDGPSSSSLFGSDVAGIGDIDGDGIGELLVGDQFGSETGTFAGSARVYAGGSGVLLYEYFGDTSEDHLGFRVAAVGDADGDGVPDFAIGAFRDDPNGLNSGSAFVHSGATGQLYLAIAGEWGDQLGRGLSDIGDVDGDGRADVLVGADEYTRVYSGADGTVLLEVSGLGRNLSAAGDVDADGVPDFVVADPDYDHGNEPPGRVRVFSGATGQVLHQFRGVSASGWFGRSATGIGDVNGDGFADIAAGHVGALDDQGQYTGSVSVFSGRDLVGDNYCGPAVDNSSGSPGVLEAWGSVLVGENLFALTARDLPLQKTGYFLGSLDPGFVQSPGGSQGNLCLGGQIARFVKQVGSTGPTGQLTAFLDLANFPNPHVVLPGSTWHFTTWFRDKNPDSTSNFTDAVRVDFE